MNKPQFIPKRKVRVTRTAYFNRIALGIGVSLDFSNAQLINFPPQATEIKLVSVFGMCNAKDNSTGVAVAENMYEWSMRIPNHTITALDPTWYAGLLHLIPISKHQINCDFNFPSRNAIQFYFTNRSGVVIDGECWLTMEFEFML